jgi:serine/threonine-protein kinase
MDNPGSQRFGRYEILSELGRGAMGVVYQARDPKINRVVAVKTISMAGQPAQEEREYRERFFREAEAAGRLSHPGIVTIFDVGEEPETRAPYIVMELVGGQSLEQLLSHGDHKLPLETALQLTLELAKALDFAHGQGVVHRDLKPANILITEDGHTKIADFGVAKINLANQSLAGRVLGTPAFMSPEQLNGDAVDGRSDLFSLGVILYTVLTGYRPFQGNSALTVCFKVVNREPVPATVLDTDLPPGLDYIIERAMAKDPAQRYQRGMEIVLDIQALQEGREPPSKGKQPASFAGADATQTADGWAGSWAAGHRAGAATPPLSAPALPPGRNAGENLPVLDIQALQEERESRSKAQQPASLAGADAAQTADGCAESSAAGQGAGAATPPLSAPGLPLRRKAGENLLDNMRKKSFAGALLFIGLLAFGLSVRHFVWPQRVAPRDLTGRAVEPPPLAGAVAPVKAAATPTAAARAVARLPKAAKPIVKKLPKPVQADGDHLAPAKVAGAGTPPTVPPVTSPAMLEIEVEHKFAAARLSIWVDDSLTYTHTLEGTDKKHLVVFHQIQGHEFHAMQLSPGKHLLRVQVTSDEPSYDQSATVTGDFVSEKETLLHIHFKKHGEMDLSLQ